MMPSHLSPPEQPDTVSFGFEEIAPAEKRLRVRGVFDTVAPRYDAMNDAMSAGLHRLWKRHAVAALKIPHGRDGYRVLDVAGGTGDVAMRVAQNCRTRNTQAQIQVIDINAAMLRVGQLRNPDMSFTQGDAEALPIATACANAYVIGFGIRNVTHIDRALAEAYRVLKPGGRFVCLEFSNLPSAPLAAAYDAYSLRVIPALGRLLAGADAPYRYLVESIRRFPTAEDFASQIEIAGFHKVQFTRLTGGVAALHTAWRL